MRVQFDGGCSGVVLVEVVFNCIIGGFITIYHLIYQLIDMNDRKSPHSPKISFRYEVQPLNWDIGGKY